MRTLHCLFLVNVSQARMQAFIAAAGIDGYTLVGGTFDQDTHDITLQPQPGQALTDSQATALVAQLPGGAGAWTVE